jgi:hypothetical protein
VVAGAEVHERQRRDFIPAQGNALGLGFRTLLSPERAIQNTPFFWMKPKPAPSISTLSSADWASSGTFKAALTEAQPRMNANGPQWGGSGSRPD